MFEIYIKKNFYCFLHIYSYWQAIYIMHTLAFKKAFHTIIHSFKKTIIHTLLGISCSLYLPMHTTIARCFPCYLYVKYQTWGSPNSSKKLSQANPNFHIFLILKPNFWIPSHKHVSLHWSYKFGFLSLGLRLASILTFLFRLYIHKTAPPPQFCKKHIHISLGHFTEHLVDARLDTNWKRMGTMWHAPLLQNTP